MTAGIAMALYGLDLAILMTMTLGTIKYADKIQCLPGNSFVATKQTAVALAVCELTFMATICALD